MFWQAEFLEISEWNKPEPRRSSTPARHLMSNLTKGANHCKMARDQVSALSLRTWLAAELNRHFRVLVTSERLGRW